MKVWDEGALYPFLKLFCLWLIEMLLQQERQDQSYPSAVCQRILHCFHLQSCWYLCSLQVVGVVDVVNAVVDVMAEGLVEIDHA